MQAYWAKSDQYSVIHRTFGIAKHYTLYIRSSTVQYVAIEMHIKNMVIDCSCNKIIMAVWFILEHNTSIMGRMKSIICK